MTLSCIGVADGLTYYVNDTAATQGAIIAKGFSQSAIKSIAGSTLTRNLTFTAIPALNTTEIFCRALGDNDEDSDVAVVIIQGTCTCVLSIVLSICGPILVLNY